MAQRSGIDYAWHNEPHPTVAALKAKGVDFTVRYVGAGSGSKPLTRAEADRLRAGGIDVAAVWESGAGRMSGGGTAGRADAAAAYKAARACGMPAGRPIYYAADSDTVTPAEAIAYLVAVREVTGPNTVGVYGSYFVVKLRHGARSTLELPEQVASGHEQRMRAVQDGVHSYWAQHFPGERVWTWQTRAWSSGNRFAGMDLWQGATVTVDGTDSDLDTAFVADFGQWDFQGDDMPTPKELWDYPLPAPDYPDGEYRTTSYSAGTFLANANAKAAQARIKAQEAADRVAALDVKVSALAGALGDDEANIIAAVKAGGSGQVDVPALAAALRGQLAPEIVAALGQALSNG